jgi:hypothetical protein
MRRAYLQARLAGFSRRDAFRVALLVGRLSLLDPPTDLWGTLIETAGEGSAAGTTRRGA